MVVLVWNSLNGGSDYERTNPKKTLATRKKKIDRRRFNVLSNIGMRASKRVMQTYAGESNPSFR